MVTLDIFAAHCGTTKKFFSWIYKELYNDGDTLIDTCARYFKHFIIQWTFGYY